MRIKDLNIQELLEFDPESGLIRFGGQRAIIIDTTAMGILRKYLIDQFGFTTTRAVLTRFGFVHGWRMADAVKDNFKWDTDDDYYLASGQIHMLEGMFTLGKNAADPLKKEGLVIRDSYEADQHIAHLGRSDVPVCWTLCGLFSGYLSKALDKEVFVLEEKCVGRDDSYCHFLGRTREEWGDERAEELTFFHQEDLDGWLDTSLHKITETLKGVEKKIRERTRRLARISPDSQDPLGLVARSAPMRRLVDLAERIAKVDSTVLITGESGTGKERIAQFLHENSSRADGPFLAINCGAITETLLESELFGHVRGAFTGATNSRSGLFEAANGGTLLLDEIGDVSPGVQLKLLRTIQEREVRRVGENQSRPIDVRVIAATNRDMNKDISEGRFRKDLYYRLKVVELQVPALRERREDILPLARILLTDASSRLKRHVTGLSPRAADQILRYDWPGNVRELENAMERAVALSRVTRTEFEDLPEEVRHAIAFPNSSDGVRPLIEVEKDYILTVFNRNGGNQIRTAEQLAIGSATLYRKLKSYGIIKGKGIDRRKKPRKKD